MTCGSTVGIEAAYLEVPSAEVGSGPLSELGAYPVLRDGGDIAAFLDNPSTRPEFKQAAISYGSYYYAGGTRISGYSQEGEPHSARILDRAVDPVRANIAKIKDLISVKKRVSDAWRAG